MNLKPKLRKTKKTLKTQPKKRAASNSSRGSVSSAGSRLSQKSVKIQAPRPKTKPPVARPKSTKPVGQAGEDECFLYGFLDPEVGARGPNTSTRPTVVIPFKASGEFTTIVNPVPKGADTPNAWKSLLSHGQTAVSNVHDDNAHMHNHSGQITFVACPHIVNATPGDGITQSVYSAVNGPLWDDANTQIGAGQTCPFQFVSGLTVDPLADDGSLGVYTASSSGNAAGGGTFKLGDTAKPYPLAAFNFPMPQHLSDNAQPWMVPNRCVGLRLTVEVNTPALTARGQVRGGDNRAWYVDAPKFVPEGTIDEQNYYVSAGSQNSYNPLASFAAGSGGSVAEVGPIVHGQIYEAVWVPGSDAVLQWDPQIKRRVAYASTIGSTGSPNVFSEYKQTMARGDLFASNPMCYLTFSGFDPTEGLSIRYGITAAYEFQLIEKSSIAPMMYDFAFAKRFIPEWSELQQLKSCGYHGDVVKSALIRSSKIRRGAECASHALRETPLRKPDPETLGRGARRPQLPFKANPMNFVWAMYNGSLSSNFSPM